jgi:uncharacterized protein YlzI (FlbEa/FlbD family)
VYYLEWGVGVIYLTKKDSEKTAFLLNHRNIAKVERIMNDTSNIEMTDGKIYSVVESKEEIKKKSMDYDIQVFSEAFKIALNKE